MVDAALLRLTLVAVAGVLALLRGLLLDRLRARAQAAMEPRLLHHLRRGWELELVLDYLLPALRALPSGSGLVAIFFLRRRMLLRGSPLMSGRPARTFASCLFAGIKASGGGAGKMFSATAARLRAQIGQLI